MNVWVLRLLGVAVALLAVYLAYVSSHQAPIVLACSAGAAILAILSIAILWERPAIGTPLAAIFLIAGIVAQMIIVPRNTSTAGLMQQTNPLAEASQSPAAPASSPQASQSAPTTSNVAFQGGAAPSPSAFASLQPASGALSAPQPGGLDYSEFIGHGTIDDGMPGPDISKVTTHALNQVVAAFGNAQATAVPPLMTADAQKFVDADAKLPVSEYSLPALAQTLPDDPLAIYRFVRDNITTDPYNGIMRGPIGTWLSRAGSPSDKLSLLAYLLVKKHVPLQFVRGTLSAGEQNRIVQSATPSPDDTTPEPTPSGLADSDSVIGKYVRDGTTFAQWSSRQLASSNVALGKDNAPRVSFKHYWIQIDQNGKLLDLDPTLPDMSEGQHLGTIDTSFKPWAMPPADEWHYIRIMLTGKFADGTEQRIVEGQAKTCDLAYAPLRLVVAPTSGSNLSRMPGARKFVVALLTAGTSLAPSTQLDLDAHGGIAQLTLEIDRKDSDGHVLSSIRNLLMPGTSRELQGPSIAGLTSILVVPGLDSNAFEVHEFVRTLAVLWNAVETTKNGRMTPAPVYPVALNEFFARDESVGDKLAQQTNGRFYRDRANIALERTWYTVDHGAVHTVLGFDVVDNSMAGVGIDANQAVVANLTRGYADTEIEGDVIGGNANYNAIAVFNSANASGVKSVVLASGGGAPAVGKFADGLTETFASGHVAIAPSATVTVSGRHAYGWWDIDPSTGSAIGRMTGGAGQAFVEEGTLLQIFSDLELAGEMVDAYHECSGEGGHGCGHALCGAMTASVLLARALEHSKHVKSPMALLRAIVVDIGIATAASFTICAAVGGAAGGGAHHGGGGEGPPEQGPPYPEPT